MFSSVILAVVMCGQIGPPQFNPGGFTYRVAPSALDPDTGLPVPWAVYQWKVQQRQLVIEQAADLAEQERYQAQQDRLKARRERLKAKTAKNPALHSAEAKAPAAGKPDRNQEIRRNLAKTREAKRGAENEREGRK